MGRTLVIDADMLVYPISQVCRQEIDWDDDLTTVSVDVGQAQEMISTRLESWMQELQAQDVILCFTGPNNWRAAVDSEYKAHRKGPKPPGFRALTSWCFGSFNSLLWVGFEADDILGCLASECEERGFEDQWVMVSGDKDLDTVPGYHHDFNRDLPGVVRYVSELEADRWHMQQTLQGDATDGYKGCPGVGPKGASKLLEGCESLGEMWEAVVGEFVRKGLTEEDALRNARLAYILREGSYDHETKEVRLWTPPI